MAERPKNRIQCGIPLEQPVHGVRRLCPACAAEKKKAADKKSIAALRARKRKKPVVHYDHCIVCGMPFPPGTNPLQKYCRVCSLEVHRIQARENARKKAAALKDRTRKHISKPCQICGKMMNQVDPERKFCSECARKKNTARSAAYQAKKKAMGVNSTPPEKKTSHEKLVEDNAAAIAKGMTYGQFKEWQRRQKELMEREETGSMA